MRYAYRCSNIDRSNEKQKIFFKFFSKIISPLCQKRKIKKCTNAPWIISISGCDLWKFKKNSPCCVILLSSELSRRDGPPRKYWRGKWKTIFLCQRANIRAVEKIKYNTSIFQHLPLVDGANTRRGTKKLYSLKFKKMENTFDTLAMLPSREQQNLLSKRSKNAVLCSYGYLSSDKSNENRKFIIERIFGLTE